MVTEDEWGADWRSADRQESATILSMKVINPKVERLKSVGRYVGLLAVVGLIASAAVIGISSQGGGEESALSSGPTTSVPQTTTAPTEPVAAPTAPTSPDPLVAEPPTVPDSSQSHNAPRTQSPQGRSLPPQTTPQQPAAQSGAEFVPPPSYGPPDASTTYPYPYPYPEYEYPSDTRPSTTTTTVQNYSFNMPDVQVPGPGFLTNYAANNCPGMGLTDSECYIGKMNGTLPRDIEVNRLP